MMQCYFLVGWKWNEAFFCEDTQLQHKQNLTACGDASASEQDTVGRRLLDGDTRKVEELCGQTCNSMLMAGNVDAMTSRT
jgi:hypothetical protein